MKITIITEIDQNILRNRLVFCYIFLVGVMILILFTPVVICKNFAQWNYNFKQNNVPIFAIIFCIAVFCIFVPVGILNAMYARQLYNKLQF